MNQSKPVCKPACSACEGRGYFKNPIYDSMGIASAKYPCAACDGTGEPDPEFENAREEVQR